LASSLFVLGGARSGKSRFAVAEQPQRGHVAFVATAQPGDGDMAQRIARHQAERPRHWTTVEEAIDLVARLRDMEGRYDAIVVDCLTLWVSNLLLRGDSDDAVLGEADGLATLIGRGRVAFTLVSNEVGGGVHPGTALGLRFCDLLGFVNQRLAAACDRVVLMVAGVPLTIKSVPGRRGDAAPQAP
jgi:adenosylcobinamide kinase/adenosylcobinamide-phosphate guanylyltransferase